jgi:hypothetical protein
MRQPFLCVFLLSFLPITAHSQLRDIDVSKLPPKVVDAYGQILPYNETLRNYSVKWTDPTPKSEVIRRFEAALKIFKEAQQQNSQNLELDLLTGLTAHLTYNLDIESAYPVALAMLDMAAKVGPDDPRPGWFRGINECETAHPTLGMDRLLSVEREHTHLAPDFWRDYALCAQLTNMPAHSVRAYGLLNESSLTPQDEQLAAMARDRIVNGDSTKKYDAAQAWVGNTEGDHVRITSFLCGFSFHVDSKAEIHPNDVKDGTCAISVTPPGYLRGLDFHTPTILFLTQPAVTDETLEAFSERVGRVRTSEAPPADLPCPVQHCLSFELRKPTVYAKAGGAHILIIAYETDLSRASGFSLEKPIEPPAREGNNFYKPQVVPRRFLGKMRTLIVLDASESIYDHARQDFDALVRSMMVEQ